MAPVGSYTWMLSHKGMEMFEKKKLEEEYEKIIKNYKTNFTKAMKESGIGSISEVYDSKPPYNPGGCFTQGWSVSETIKIMLEE